MYDWVDILEGLCLIRGRLQCTHQMVTVSRLVTLSQDDLDGSTILVQLFQEVHISGLQADMSVDTKVDLLDSDAICDIPEHEFHPLALHLWWGDRPAIPWSINEKTLSLMFSPDPDEI